MGRRWGVAPGLSPVMVTNPACASPAQLPLYNLGAGGVPVTRCGQERRLTQDSRPSCLSQSLSGSTALGLPPVPPRVLGLV